MDGKARKNKYHFLFATLFFGWTILLTILNVIPGESLPDTKNSSFRWDYLEHAFVFFVFSSLYLLWRFNYISKRNEKVLFIAIGTIYAICTELVQFFVDGRTLNPIDIIFNLIGLYAGFFLSLLILKKLLARVITR